MSRIFYVAPDSDKPSWGLGIIYHHVSFLCRNGYDAYILHHQKNFEITWLKVNGVNVTNLEALPLSNLTNNDVLVVPEVEMQLNGLKNCKAEKIVFIQAMGFAYESMPLGENHKSLGFSHVFVIMPHMLPIVKDFIQLPLTMIPPFIPDQFFEYKPKENKKKQIVLFPKFSNIDYSIVKKLLHNKLGEKKTAYLKFFEKSEWELIELKGLPHKQVPSCLQDSSIFISLNCFEALNTSVVEAMASRCIVFCYEGFGPKDYLRNEENAFVFPNNEAYALCKKLFDVIDNYDIMTSQLDLLRQKAFETASIYNAKTTEDCLIRTFNKILHKN